MSEILPPAPDFDASIRAESIARRALLKSRLAELNSRVHKLSTGQKIKKDKTLQGIESEGAKAEQQAIADQKVAEAELHEYEALQTETKTERQRAEENEQRFRQATTLLHTADSKGLSQKEAEEVEDQLVKAKIDPARTVTIETAASDGYETHEFKQIAKLASRLGRPVTKNGRPLLAVLSRPETKRYLATLAALQRAFNTTSTPLPVATFSELDTPDLEALIDGFSNHLEKVRPDFLSSNSYKWGDLAAEAHVFVQKANDRRIAVGTQLFRKI